MKFMSGMRLCLQIVTSFGTEFDLVGRDGEMMAILDDTDLRSVCALGSCCW